MAIFQYEALREIALDLAALFWPTACVVCGAADRDCCRACLARLRAPPADFEIDLGGLPCLVRGRYAGALRAVLIAYKHEGRVGFASPLGQQLRGPLVKVIEGATQIDGNPPLIVAVPSRPVGVRKRGYRHVELLIAKALTGGFGGRFRCQPSLHPSDHAGRRRERAKSVRALRTTRGRRGQVGLTPAERERNAHHVAVRRSAIGRVRDRRVVLVDDIITTGASVRAARSALELAGAKVVAVVALCAAERRDALGESVGVTAKLTAKLD